MWIGVLSRQSLYRPSLDPNLDSVGCSKCRQGVQLVANWTGLSVLDIVRTLIALPPLLKGL